MATAKHKQVTLIEKKLKMKSELDKGVNLMPIAKEQPTRKEHYIFIK